MTNTYIPFYGAYSFMDVVATISGPGWDSFMVAGLRQIAGPNSGSAEEGVTIALGEETNTQTIGADGSVMNSLHASRAGTATFRLLKTSPVNRALMIVYYYQRQQSSLWAQNTITVNDVSRGDQYNLQGCAFVRFPTNSYAKVGNTLEWEFHVSLCDIRLGSGDTLRWGNMATQLAVQPPQLGPFGMPAYPGSLPVATQLPGGRLPPGRLRDETTRVW